MRPNPIIEKLEKLTKEDLIHLVCVLDGLLEDVSRSVRWAREDLDQMN